MTTQVHDCKVSLGAMAKHNLPKMQKSIQYEPLSQAVHSENKEKKSRVVFLKKKACY
jgi:hypothetical protein